MESAGEYSRCTRVGDAVLEGNRRAAKSKEENNAEQRVRGKFCFASSRDIVEPYYVCGLVCFVSLRGDEDDWRQL